MREEYDIEKLNPRKNPYTKVKKVQISINGDTSGKCRYTYKLSKMYKADDRLVTKESDEKVESTE